MVTKKIVRADNWDGRSRPSDDKYRKNWNDIFGKRENDELAESYKESRRQQKERDDKKK